MNFETRPHLNTRPLSKVKILGMAKLGIFAIHNSTNRRLNRRSERYKAMKMGGPRGELDGDRPLLVKGFLSLISESFEIFEAVITLLEIRAGELV